MKIEVAPIDILFQTAARLFYQHGYRAVGGDTVAAESGIGKMTLYRHYLSRDNLTIAYLHGINKVFWNNFEQITKEAPTSRKKLLIFFEALRDYVFSPACYGCPFLDIATEYPEADYPGQQVAIEHKQSVRAWFDQLVEEAGARQPEELPNAIFLLMDGTYMAARMFGSSPYSPAANVATVARQLIDGQCVA